MKKIITLITAIILSIFACINVSATESDITVITLNNVDVKFSSNTSLTFEEKQIVAEKLVYGDEYQNVETYNVLCSLFGHKYTTEIVTTINHRVDSTAPRCLEVCSEVSLCSRCGDTTQTIISEVYIHCCP
jgi:hypothetical protein